MYALQQLYRYPVKGLSPEPLATLALTPGHAVPGDRIYALTNGSWRFDPIDPQPQPKTQFLMLMKYEKLARLRTQFDDDTQTLRIDAPDGTQVVADLTDAAGRQQVERFFADYMGELISGMPQLVASPGHHFTDVSVISPEMMRAVSLVNLASVRALGERLGTPVDPLRFRANLYIDGPEAWAEFDWIDREFMVGDVRVKGVLRTVRCLAVNVNPATAERDMELPKALKREFGHADMGIYLEVLDGGVLRPGAPIRCL